MQILVIDGQGGGIGSRLVGLLKAQLPDHCALHCVGTNSLATSAMLKAGAQKGATGGNAVKVNAARADVILGPLGILLADGIMGEVSPDMATAISGAPGEKILIPSSNCGCQVAGTQPARLEEYLQEAVRLTMARVNP